MQQPGNSRGYVTGCSPIRFNIWWNRGSSWRPSHWRDGKMNEGGVVRLECPVETDKCRIEVPDAGGQYS